MPAINETLTMSADVDEHQAPASGLKVRTTLS
jgi:hypothetical protein